MEILTQNDKMVINSLEFHQVSTYRLIYDNQINVKVEINIYDADTGVLIETVYEKLPNVANKYILFNDFPNTNTGQIILDTESYLRSRRYISGNFSVSYKFYTDILGSEDENNQVSIFSISPTRKEVSIKNSNRTLNTAFNNLSDLHFYQFSHEFEFTKYANFGNNKLSLVLNAKNEYDATTNLSTVILKLYDALSADFIENENLWIV